MVIWAKQLATIRLTPGVILVLISSLYFVNIKWIDHTICNGNFLIFTHTHTHTQGGVNIRQWTSVDRQNSTNRDISTFLNFFTLIVDHILYLFLTTQHISHLFTFVLMLHSCTLTKMMLATLRMHIFHFYIIFFNFIFFTFISDFLLF